MVTIKNQSLNILMNGMLVGKLQRSNNGVLTFVYDEKWLQMPGARPISLSLPLIKREFTGDLVYHYFDNLLPDNSQIRARIQAKFQCPTNQPFDLLASIGKDCIGALQMMDEAVISFKQEIRFEVLNKREIAAILRGYQHYPLGMKSDSEFRISIAGAQEKSAFLYYKNKWCRPLGSTPTTHIFKLPIGFIPHQPMDLTDSCENEWLCTKIAEAFGLPIAKANLLYFEDVKVLAVERFDRQLAENKEWIIRLPQEDMCQAMGISPNLKYQSDGGPGINDIMRLLLGADNPEKNREQFICSQILFWLLAAIDGHAKNFSLLIKPEGRYSLTPLYDILSAYPLINKKQLQKQKIKMAMALKGKNNHYLWHLIQPRHFLSTAADADFSVEKTQAILEEMLEKIDQVIDQVARQLPENFPHYIAESIFNGMKLIKKGNYADLDFNHF